LNGDSRGFLAEEVRDIWYDTKAIPDKEQSFPIWGTMLNACGLLAPSPRNPSLSWVNEVAFRSKLELVRKCAKIGGVFRNGIRWECE